MIIQERKAQLKDMTGKDIAKSLLGKEMFTALRDGQTLTFGGKEIEICSPLDEEDYASGRVFMTNLGTKVTTPLMGARLKPFVNPSAEPKAKDVEQTNFKPLFDPSAPDALVLFHSTSENEVSVVVDPFLSRSLRPHQRDGIQFLYDCVIGSDKQTNHGCILADGDVLFIFLHLSNYNHRDGFGKNLAVHHTDMDTDKAREESISRYPSGYYCYSKFTDQKLEEGIFEMVVANED